jgi:hypothetical protein
VNKANQAITFGALTNVTYGATPITVSATGGASGQPVTFTAGPGTVCNASGTNGTTITIVGGGTCTVNADQAGNGNFNAAPQVPQSFTVAKAALTVTGATLTYSKASGGSLPAFTYTVGGLVNGDPATIVTGTQTCFDNTPAPCSTTSPDGTYAIGQGDLNTTNSNYTFAYINGSLTIGP